MQRWWTRIALAIVLAALCRGGTAGAAAPAAPLAGVLGQLPGLEDVILSPNATRLVFVRTQGDTRYVSVFSVAERKVIYSTRVAEQKLRGLEWVDEDHFVLMTSVTSMSLDLIGGRREWLQAQIIDTRSARVRPIDLDVPETATMNVVLCLPQVRVIDGRSMLIVTGFYRSGDRLLPGLFWVDPDTGRTTLQVRSERPGTNWLVGEDGTVIASTEHDSTTGRWTVRVRLGEHMVPTLNGESELDPPVLLGLAPDPGYAILSIKEGDRTRWRKLSLVDGKLGADFTQGEPLHALLQERTSPRLIGGRPIDERGYVFFDVQRQKQWDSIAASYAGANLTLASHSDDFGKLVVLVDGAELGYYYELFDLAARRGVSIGAVYAGLSKLAPATEIDYAADDGLTIHAVLTLPRERSAKDLPLIVLAHGGPASHVTARFDWWREALAERGYAVLEPNFRGSDSSERLKAAGFGEWGRKMQTDLSDGVRTLVKQGIIDPKRVCIVGASYGGYAALAGVAFDPGVYRCAVAVAGISDLKAMLRWQDAKVGRRDPVRQRYWDRFLGTSGAGDPKLQAISPLQHVDAITAPVLLIHGKDDTVVGYEQSELMRDAMRKAGKTVEFVTLKDEDHWLSRSATRAQMLDATLRFLDAHNPAH